MKGAEVTWHDEKESSNLEVREQICIDQAYKYKLL